MGSPIFVPILFPVFILGTILVRKSSLNCPQIKSKAKDAYDRIFFNSILRFVEETYLITTLCSFINIKTVHDKSISIDFNYILSLASQCIVVGYPIVIIVFYFRKVE